MWLGNLSKACVLVDERDAIEKQLRLIGCGWGEYWFIKYAYPNDSSPRPSYPIPMAVVNDFLRQRLAKNTADLETLGVTVE